MTFPECLAADKRETRRYVTEPLFNDLEDGRILPNLTAATKTEALLELAEAVHNSCPEIATDTLYEALREREALGSTGIGEGIAIPHGKIKGLERIVLCFGRSAKGVPFDALDSKPTHLFFLLLAPVHSAAAYLSCLARLSRFLKNITIRTRLMNASDKLEIAEILAEAD